MKTQEGGWNAGFPSLLWHLAQLGLQSFQLYEPAAIYPQINSPVLSSVRDWVDPRATECGQKE